MKLGLALQEFSLNRLVYRIKQAASSSAVRSTRHLKLCLLNFPQSLNVEPRVPPKKTCLPLMITSFNSTLRNNVIKQLRAQVSE
jgi:hypothetical protein